MSAKKGEKKAHGHCKKSEEPRLFARSRPGPHSTKPNQWRLGLPSHQQYWIQQFTLYASIETTEDDKGIYRSEDRGISWTKQGSYIPSYPFCSRKIL